MIIKNKIQEKIPNWPKKPFLGPPKNPQKVKKRPPKRPFFDPPEIPKIAIFDHFLDPKFDPQNVNFWPKPQKRPFFDPPQIPKILENGPFGENRGFQARFEPQKGGGVGVYPGTPQKGHFWPFLAIFDHFWPFLTPFLGCPRPPKNPPPSGCESPPKTPLARRTISNNRVIRPQIWNLRRKRGFFCTPTGAGNVSESGRKTRLLSEY